MGNDTYDYYRTKDAFHRDQDRRYENFRDDLAYDARVRERDMTEARDALRSGRTAWAIHKMGGTDIAIDHLQSTPEPAADRSATPSAEAQFGEHYDNLHLLLERCTVLPRTVTQPWRRALTFGKDIELKAAQRTVDAVMAEHQQARTDFQPSVFDVAKGMRFMTEMDDLKAELDWLGAILVHVEDYQATHG